MLKRGNGVIRARSNQLTGVTFKRANGIAGPLDAVRWSLGEEHSLRTVSVQQSF